MIASPAPAFGTMKPALMKLRTKRVRAKANSPRGVALIPTGTAATCSASDVTCAIEFSTFHKKTLGNMSLTIMRTPIVGAQGPKGSQDPDGNCCLKRTPNLVPTRDTPTRYHTRRYSHLKLSR